MTSASAEQPGLRVGFQPRRPWLAAALLAIAALLVIVGLAARPSVAPHPIRMAGAVSDEMLYARVVERVHRGEGFYSATFAEQRRGDFPVKPFVAVRPPTLAYVLGALPSETARRGLLMALASLTLGAWVWRLARMQLGLASFTAMLLLMGTGAKMGFAPDSYLFHEVWAGLLIALSLALRRPGAWRASLAAALLAVAFRELAGAYLLAMAALAWRDGARREALAWLAGLGLAAAGLAAHAFAVAAHVRPGDAASQGWLRIGGWPFALATLKWNLGLGTPQRWATAIVAPFALLGLLGWRDPLGERIALTVLGYLAAFVVFGRPENAYWGILIAPIWPLGLALAPAALRDLMNMLRLTPRQA